MRLIGNVLHVEAHEWAWSRRTQGFPVYALFADGSIREIGSTAKRYATYEVPEGAIGIIRKYVSNQGYRTFYVYTLPGLAEFPVAELFDFRTNVLPNSVREAFEKAFSKLV